LPCNGSLDISIVERINSTDIKELSLYIGLAEVERIPFDKDHILFKMLLGRMYNCKYKLDELVKSFGPSHKTIRLWGKALLSSDLDYIRKVFAGHENKRKITPEIDGFIRGTFNAIKDNVKNFSQIIIGEIGKRYNKEISGESLRIIFNDERKSNTDNPSSSGDKSVGDKINSIANEKSTPSENLENPEVVENRKYSLCRTAWANDCLDESLSVNCSTKIEVLSDSDLTDCSNGKRENLCDTSEQSGSNISLSPKYFPFSGLPLTRLDEWTEPVLLNHCGLIFFSHLIDQIFPEKSFALQRQWLSQILLGMINIEQSKHLSHKSLAKLVGPTIKDLGEQRTELKVISDFASTMEIVQRNRFFTGDKYQNIFYYDPHTKEYTGMFKYLKAWIAHSHNIRKGMHSDFIHTIDGYPCFVQIFDNFYDLRERFFICSDIFKKSFLKDSIKPVTWIIDRGIYGMETLMEIRASGDNIITWDKGYKRNAWQNNRHYERFSMDKYKNNSEICKSTVFEYQQNVWNKSTDFRQIIVKAYKPNGNNIEVSIIVNKKCTIDDETIVRLMFNKWIQENDFKFLAEFFGIDQITSYRFIPYSRLEDKLNDRQTESTIYKVMCKKRRGLENELTKIIRKGYDLDKKYNRDLNKLGLENTHRQKLLKKEKQKKSKNSEKQKLYKKESDRLSRLICKYPERQEKIKNKYEDKFNIVRNSILKMEGMIETMNIDISALIKNESRLQRLIKENYMQPDIRAKNYMDMLKIIARNMFYELLKIFRPLYNNYRDDCATLREITRLPGIIVKDGTVIKVKLWANADYSKGMLVKIKDFLQIMTDKINTHFQNKSGKIKIELLSSTVQMDKLVNEKFKFTDLFN